MIHAFALLAQGAGKGPATQPNRPFLVDLFFGNNSFMFLMLLIVGVFYFMMIKSKRSQDKQVKDMLANLKKGDRVQTIGGILGTVVEAREDEVLLKVDESANAKVRFVRKAIARVVESDRTGGGKSAS